MDFNTARWTALWLMAEPGQASGPHGPTLSGRSWYTLSVSLPGAERKPGGQTDVKTMLLDLVSFSSHFIIS